MDVLTEITSLLTKEEVRFYKLNLPFHDNFERRKDVMLFDYFRKHQAEANEEKIHKKLYGASGKNAFYRLKNRLIEELNCSLTRQHYANDEVLYLYHLLSVVRIYASRSKHQLAYYFLRKAEQKAGKLENHELLDVIYGELIQLSHYLLSIDPEECIRKRTRNSANLARIREMDDILALVSYRLKVTQNFGEAENSTLILIEQVTGEFEAQKELLRSSRFRFKLYSLVSQQLIQRKDFERLEAYLLHTWRDFLEEGLFNRNNHDTKLQMLTYLANALFKNGKIEKSLEFVRQLREAMDEYNGLYFERYEIFYYNALVNNYSTIDQQKAIEVLKEMQRNKNLQKTAFYEIFIYLNMAASYFDLKQFSQAAKNLNKLYLLESYKTADSTLRFKIAVAEMIIRFELADHDFWMYRFDQICREFKGEMVKESNQKDQEMLKILHLAVKSATGMKDRDVRSTAAVFLEKYSDKQQDDEIIRYSDWLYGHYPSRVS